MKYRKYRNSHNVTEVENYAEYLIKSFDLTVAKMDKFYIQAVIAIIDGDSAIYITLDEHVLDLDINLFEPFLSLYSRALNDAVCREWSLKGLMKRLGTVCLAETIKVVH